MVQVGKVDMEKFEKCKLRISTKCFHTLSLLEKHWKKRISIRHIANFVWRHWIVPLINHLNVIKFYAIHVKTLKAYQLWWNENKFKEMLKYHDRSLCKGEVRSEGVMRMSLSYWMMHKCLALSQICMCLMLSMMGHLVHLMTFNYMFWLLGVINLHSRDSIFHVNKEITLCKVSHYLHGWNITSVG